jgi:peptidoglycan-N-acetylglucosamine deacetylase
MLANISLDLDNKWSYLKTHGDFGWESYPTYLPKVVPSILEALDRIGLKITFFIVGQDATPEVNREALRSISEAGHEIGNHSFNHEPWLHLYGRQQLVEEFDRSEEAIYAATGCWTVGFRGPGFSYSEQVLEVLAERGYLYDASTFPTFLGPVARAYYFFTSPLSQAERAQRKQLFGSFKAGFQSLRPFYWNTKPSKLLEIPVTTMPWFKVPIHFSYIMYLASYSRSLAETYFYNSLRFCWLNRIQPSLLLHPLDFMGRDDDSQLAFFPGMSIDGAKKRELAEKLLTWMSKGFECLTMAEHAHRISNVLDSREAKAFDTQQSRMKINLSCHRTEEAKAN